MKRLFFISLLFLVGAGGKAQSWSPVGEGVDNLIWTLTADTVNNYIYAGGWFDSAGTVEANYIARWDETTWSYVGNAANDLSLGGYVSSSIIHNGVLHLGGRFGTAEAMLVSQITNWDGANWNALGTGVCCGQYLCIIKGMVDAFVKYNGDLIAGGIFKGMDGNIVNAIARWDGIDWYSLGTGMDDCILSLVVYNGDLYAGGRFLNAGGSPAESIAKWNGVNWSALPQFLSTYPESFKVFNNELYIGGGGRLLRWDGVNIDTVAFVKGLNPNVLDMEIYNGELIVAGFFDTIAGMPANNIASFDGTNWITLDTGTTHSLGPTYNSSIEALAVLNGCLYAGGWFDEAGGQPASFIAKWCDSTTTVNEKHSSAQPTIYPNPTTGTFTVQGTATEIQVYDLFGNLVLRTNKRQVDMSGYPSGIYMVKAGEAVRKLILH